MSGKMLGKAMSAAKDAGLPTDAVHEKAKDGLKKVVNKSYEMATKAGLPADVAQQAVVEALQALGAEAGSAGQARTPFA